MKKLILMALLGVMGFLVVGQNKVNVKGKQCSHCNMMIKDPLFASMAIEGKKEHTFDAIECLVNFLKEHNEKAYSSLLVADYANNGELTEAQSATYLKSKEIPSPMGAYISAFRSQEDAKRIQKEKGGDLYDWEGLKQLFKNSRFGLLDHPTHHHHRPGAYAPIGVMGDHLHHKGGFMVSLRYMDMIMRGNLRGPNEIDDMSIFQDYMVSPQSMNMHMYMLGVMYAPSDKLTVMVMQNYVKNSMELRNMSGMEFSTESEGLGDLRVSALYGLIARENSSFHMNVIVNIPVGRVEMRDDTPMMENMKLPYPMQLGSGTLDFTFGGTYKGSSNELSWGIQPLGMVRVGENSEGYRLGNQIDLNGWLSYDLSSWVSVSGRVMTSKIGELSGQDEELNSMMSPPANVDNTGFMRIRSLLGANFSFGDQPVLRNFKLGLEYGIPIYQDVEGIQMSEKSTLSTGLRYSI